jgi:hypothetical protein
MVHRARRQARLVHQVAHAHAQGLWKEGGDQGSLAGGWVGGWQAGWLADGCATTIVASAHKVTLVADIFKQQQAAWTAFQRAVNKPVAAGEGWTVLEPFWRGRSEI